MVQRKYYKKGQRIQTQKGSGGIVCCDTPNVGSIPPDKLKLFKSYNESLKSKIPYKN